MSDPRLRPPSTFSYGSYEEKPSRVVVFLRRLGIVWGCLTFVLAIVAAGREIVTQAAKDLHDPLLIATAIMFGAGAVAMLSFAVGFIVWTVWTFDD